MVGKTAKRYGISNPNSMRRAIWLNEWIKLLKSEGDESLGLGARNRKDGEVETFIPLRSIPEF